MAIKEGVMFKAIGLLLSVAVSYKFWLGILLGTFFGRAIFGWIKKAIKAVYTFILNKVKKNEPTITKTT